VVADSTLTSGMGILSSGTEVRGAEMQDETYLVIAITAAACALAISMLWRF
jgi:hypothetical protein